MTNEPAKPPTISLVRDYEEFTEEGGEDDFPKIPPPPPKKVFMDDGLQQRLALIKGKINQSRLAQPAKALTTANTPRAASPAK